jgi:UMF1 family MFS transporter
MEVLGWINYDWANSAFYTIVVTVLAGPYLQALARSSVGRDGVVLSFGSLGSVTPESMISFFLGISILSQVLFLPLLGAIADYTHLKKRFMVIFTYAGVLSSSLLFFIVGDSFLVGCALLMLANMSFAAANVFYNAFLVEVAAADQRDKVSSYGYAAGYSSGVVMLVLCLSFLSYSDEFGLEKGLAVRISMLAATLWWGAFSVFTFLTLKARGAIRSIPDGQSVLTVGFSEIGTTFRSLAKLPHTLRFLVAYLFYNDGIQTVILTSSIFINYELFEAKGLESDQAFLLSIFLGAQIFAVIGGLVFERVARVLGAKSTILLCLALWVGIVVYAYGFFQTEFQARLLGAFIGFVLGSAQALSRSLYSQMIPLGRESSFFGIYEISEKGTSWLGMMVFSVVVASTGSYRSAILAVILFFVLGSIMLIFTDTDRAVAEAAAFKEEAT